MNIGSPVKLIRPKTELEIKSFKCLICGKQAKKNDMRNPKDQGIASFINALLIRGEWNGFTIDELKEYIDLDLKTWKGDKSQIRWHINCYSGYTSSRNLQFLVQEAAVRQLNVMKRQYDQRKIYQI